MTEAAGFQAHDHARCRANAMERARSACATRGLRLTPAREKVLAILLESHRAMGAYDVLERLAGDGGARAQPPAAYRALDFLVANGFAHRIERLNAFIACARPDCAAEGDPVAGAFMICRSCRAVAEIAAPALDIGVARAAEAAGFSIERATVEIEGLCPRCVDATE